MTHQDLYEKIGIYNLGHFIKTPVITADTFFFPSGSNFYYFKPGNGLEYIDRSIPYLTKAKKATVLTICKYGTNTEGEFKEYLDPKELLKDQIKTEKRYKFLQPNIIENKNDFTIYNYGILNYIHQYKPNPKNTLIMYNNTANRLLEDLKGLTSAHRYINFDVPYRLPSMEELDIFAKNVSVGNLSKLDYRHLNLVELWKFCTPELKHTSIFNKISNENLRRTTLIMSIENRMILLNLNRLFKFIKEYEDQKYTVNIESRSNFLNSLGLNLESHSLNLEASFGEEPRCDANILRQALYVVFYKLINNKPVNPNKLEQVEALSTVKFVKSIQKELKNNKMANNTVIDDYVNDIEDDVGLDYEIPDDGFDVSKLEADEAILRANIDRTFSSIEELKNLNPREEHLMRTVKELNYMLENKLISKANYKKYMESFENQEEIKNPFDKKSNMGSLLDMEVDDLKLNDFDTKLADSILLFDKKANENVTDAMEKKYLKEQFRKDISRVVYSLQNRSNVITDFTVETTTNIMGSTETYKVDILNISGKKTTLTFDIPFIDEDGTFYIYGNQYRLRKQRTDLPLRKKNGTTVLLNSYYGKVFVHKAKYAKEDFGRWIKSILLKKQEKGSKNYDSKLSNLYLLSSSAPDRNLPLLYNQFAREIKSFSYDGCYYIFDYDNRNELNDTLTQEDIAKIEGNDKVLIGVDGKKLLTMDFVGMVYENDKPKGLLLDLLNIDTTDAPIEYGGIVILKKYVPIAILLCYYLGINNVLKILNAKYEKFEGNKRVKADNNSYVIRFKDTKLLVTKDNGITDMILAGMLAVDKLLVNYNMADFNTKDKMKVILHTLFSMESSIRYINELEMLETMFIDPMTANVLRQMKEPINFPGLLIRACELILNDNYKHPNSIENMVIKGYERVAGMIYKEIVYALKDYENKSAYGNSKIMLDRYAVMTKINEDNTKVPVEDLNPISVIKQKEDVSYLGDGGRNKETMTKETRELGVSEIGIMSEATKDSGSVGITAYMSANPNIDNISGMITKDNNNLSWSNRLSTVGMLTPFGLTDDGKRLAQIWSL